MSQLTIVTYHYVRDLARSRYPEIKGQTTERFIEQLDYMDRHYTFVTIEDCLAALNGEPLPQTAALLTFDDGLKEVWTAAFPLLKKYGLRATCFLIPGVIPDRPGVLRPNLESCWRGEVALDAVVEPSRGDDALCTWGARPNRDQAPSAVSASATAISA